MPFEYTYIHSPASPRSMFHGMRTLMGVSSSSRYLQQSFHSTGVSRRISSGAFVEMLRIRVMLPRTTQYIYMQLLARMGFALPLFLIGAPCCSPTVSCYRTSPGSPRSAARTERRNFLTTLLPLLVDELSCQGNKKASLGRRLLVLFESIGC